MRAKIQRVIKWVRNFLHAPARIARLSETIEVLNARLVSLENDTKQVSSHLPHLAHAQELYRVKRDLESLRVLAGQMRSSQLKSAEAASLKDVEFKIFSQFGDDGIIEWLISNIDIEHKTFIEFGVEDYSESNTRFLLMNHNWRGLIIDGSPENVRLARSSEWYWQHELTAVCHFVDAENINRIFVENGMKGDIGLLSIDIDGNDFWIWKSITAVNPCIVIVEFNSVFGPESAVTVPYNPRFDRTKAHYSNLYFGASLRALCDLAKDKGYCFVGCNSHGNNAYFVRQDKLGKLRTLDVEEGYVQSRYRESRDRQGELTFIADIARQDVIEDMPVYDIHADCTIPLKSALNSAQR